MTPVFADTFYFLALLNERDAAHARAVNISESEVRPLLTTAWVLTEVADGLSRSAQRAMFGDLLDALRDDPHATIVTSTEELFDAAVRLYRNRTDKHWSLTDCTSFVVMQRHGVSEALTADHHFEQAGFVALLK